MHPPSRESHDCLSNEDGPSLLRCAGWSEVVVGDAEKSISVADVPTQEIQGLKELQMSQELVRCWHLGVRRKLEVREMLCDMGRLRVGGTVITVHPMSNRVDLYSRVSDSSKRNTDCVKRATEQASVRRT